MRQKFLSELCLGGQHKSRPFLQAPLVLPDPKVDRLVRDAYGRHFPEHKENPLGGPVLLDEELDDVPFEPANTAIGIFVHFELPRMAKLCKVEFYSCVNFEPVAVMPFRTFIGDERLERSRPCP